MLRQHLPKHAITLPLSVCTGQQERERESTDMLLRKGEGGGGKEESVRREGSLAAKKEALFWRWKQKPDGTFGKHLNYFMK